MTKEQFTAAVSLIKSGADLSSADDSILSGCAGEDFKPVTVTLEAAARFIKWHAVCLNGQIDGEALNEMRAISRKKWLIV